MRGAVSQCAQVMEHVIVSVANRVEVYSVEGQGDEADRHAPRAALRRGESASLIMRRRRRRASSPPDEVVGGLFSILRLWTDVGAVAACQRERGRGDGVVTRPRHREAVAMIIRASARA